MKLSRASCVWLTGLSAAGKSTIADALAQELAKLDIACTVLDGDRLRTGLNKDLGFSHADRTENIRRVGEVAHLMVDSGLVAIAAVISPYRQDRQAARALFPAGQFIEVFVDTPMEVCQQRDPKGLYRKAIAGNVAQFTGVTSTYETPERPEIRLVHDGNPVAVAVATILRYLRDNGLLDARAG